MVRKGEFELRYHIDNTQFIDSTFGLTAQMPTIPLRLYVYCTENAQRKRKLAKVFCLKPASNSLTSAPSTGGRENPLFRDAWNGNGCEVVSKSRRCSGAQRDPGSNDF